MNCLICRGGKYPHDGYKICGECFERLYHTGEDVREYLKEKFPEGYTYLCETYPELVLLLDGVKINNEFATYLGEDIGGASIVVQDKALICYRLGGFNTVIHEILHYVFRDLELDPNLEERLVRIASEHISISAYLPWNFFKTP